MIDKTPAIALRIDAFSRTSHMVTWITPGRGRIVTSIKGACRPKSSFLGQYDLGTRCELLYYRRERDGVHIARECEPLDGREQLHQHWRGALAAGYLCDLVDRTAQAQLPAAATFRLLDRTLSILHLYGDLTIPISWFELQLLGTLGLAPDFTPCADCIEREGRHCRFVLSRGRLACPASPSYRPDGATVVMAPGVLDRLRIWQTSDRPPPVTESFQDAIVVIAVRRFIGMFMQHHLDMSQKSRQSLIHWLSTSVSEQIKTREESA